MRPTSTSVVDNVLKSYTMFYKDFMRLPGFHTSSSNHCMSSSTDKLCFPPPTVRLITLRSERRSWLDREPAAIKTSGTGPRLHQTFYCCTRRPQHPSVDGYLAKNALFYILLLPCLWRFPALSRGHRGILKWVLTTLCLYLRKRMGLKRYAM